MVTANSLFQNNLPRTRMTYRQAACGKLLPCFYHIRKGSAQRCGLCGLLFWPFDTRLNLRAKFFPPPRIVAIFWGHRESPTCLIEQPRRLLLRFRFRGKNNRRVDPYPGLPPVFSKKTGGRGFLLPAEFMSKILSSPKNRCDFLGRCRRGPICSAKASAESIVLAQA